MRTIDARHLDVPTEELLEYLSANIRMSVRSNEQQIIITPSQLENIEEVHHLHVTSSMGYMCTFMGVPVKVEPRELSIRGNPFPEPIIDESEELAKMYLESITIASAEERIRGEYVPKKPKAKVPKEEVKQQGRPRHMPVWKD